MNKIKTLGKGFAVSLKIKGAFSMAISLLGFVASFLPVLLAGQLRALTDELQLLAGGTGGARQAITVFAGIAGLYLAELVITGIQQYTNGIDEIKIRKYIKHTLLQYKCRVKYKYIENFDDFQKRLAFIEEYAGVQMAKSIGSMITILQLILAFSVAAMALWQISPLIVIVLFVTGIPAALLSYFQQEETLRSRAKWMEEGALVIHYFHMIGGGGYSIDGLQEIRHFALFDYLKARWRAIADEYVGKKNKILGKHVKFNTLADFLRSAVYLGVLIIAAWSIYQNPEIGLGVFTLVFTLSGQLQTATGDCLVDIMNLAQSIPYMEAFFYLDELEQEPEESSEIGDADGEISFSGVSFTYPNTEAQVLKGINLEIKAGEKIAVVGENGSGKSTFISLLCGMFEPQEGEIKVGGVPVKKNPEAARAAVSVVFQDFAHYEASIRENISLSDKGRKADDEEIIALLEKINVSDVVLKQKNGLSELVGSFSEKANNLSGGEWQKISIARAAYRSRAKIMILDEPTSALDPMAEAQLYKNFTALTGDKTTILISHRLGITTLVDRILVFKDGRIIEDGPHKQLLKKNGHYAQMYRAQAQWYA